MAIVQPPSHPLLNSTSLIYSHCESAGCLQELGSTRQYYIPITFLNSIPNWQPDSDQGINYKCLVWPGPNKPLSWYLNREPKPSSQECILHDVCIMNSCHKNKMSRKKTLKNAILCTKWIQGELSMTSMINDLSPFIVCWISKSCNNFVLAGFCSNFH